MITRPLNENEMWVVRAIRLMWAGDIAMLAIERNQEYEPVDYDYPFGNPDWEDEGFISADHAIYESFRKERVFHDDDLTTIWTLIRG